MGVEQFVAEHAGIVAVFCGFLVLLIVRLIIQSYKQLSKSIDALSKAVEAIQGEIKTGRKEAQNDRENDRRIVGHLLDRMQAQETLCSTTRQFCPLRQGTGPIIADQRIGEIDRRKNPEI